MRVIEILLRNSTLCHSYQAMMTDFKYALQILVHDLLLFLDFEFDTAFTEIFFAKNTYEKRFSSCFDIYKIYCISYINEC